MNLLSILRKRYDNVLKQSEIELRKRCQLNMVVDKRLVKLLKRLAIEFATPRDIVGEHVIEVGCYYLTRAIESEKKTDVLRQHLINVHMVDSGVDDSETILRIGESGNISQLVSKAELVNKSWGKLQRAIAITERTGNLEYLKRCEKELLRAAIDLAIYLKTHHIDELQDDNAKEGQQETNL